MPLQIEMVFGIAILIMSVVIHEVAHGVAANWLGDPTARLSGRLTLNPLPHLDMVGSVLLPLVLVVSGSPLLFGWAKPVPYNPFNLQRGGRFAEAIVAGAGPATNIVLAVLFGIVTQVLISSGAPQGTIGLAFTVVLVNVMLTFFNLLPIPPLDGSKIISPLLPGFLSRPYEQVRAALEFNPLAGFGLVVLFILVFGSVFSTLVITTARFLTGI